MCTCERCLVIRVFCPMFNLKNVVYFSMVLVESIPEHMSFKGNVTLGLPLEKAWKTLISMATEQVDLVSFYWTLTGEDISVNSSSDQPVSGPQTHNQSKKTTMLTQASVKCVKVLNAACSGVPTFVSTRLCPRVCVHCRDETSWQNLRSCPLGTSVSERWPVFPVWRQTPQI